MDKIILKTGKKLENLHIENFQARNILFVSSPYRIPALKEDICPGPGNITTAASMDEAADMLRANAFDLAFIEKTARCNADTNSLHTLKTIRPDVPMVLLVPPAGGMVSKPDKNMDHTFIWSGTPEMFNAMVRLIEDQYCIDDTRQAFILVEDSVAYTSFFLPALYREMDALFPGAQTPKLVLADTYETAMKQFRELGGRLAGILSDTRLPRNGKEAPSTGVDILSAVCRKIPGLPMMLMSAEKENRDLAARIPAPFLDKNSDRLELDLHDFFRNHVTKTHTPVKKTQSRGRYALRTCNTGFTKIGQGAIGGKARGLFFLDRLLNSRPDLAKAYPEMAVTIPATLVLCTDIFDRFIRDNSLADQAAQSLTKLVQAFIDAPLPPELLRQLETFLAGTIAPLAVRSSSLLEDACSHPCTGLYKTYMIPNNHGDPEIRLAHLTTAVKLVYASAYYKNARAFLHSTTARPFEDSMAVMIQEAAGRQYKDFFYPAISGTAQSVNFYPAAGAKAEDGILHLALGMGHTLAQGEEGFRVSPKHPGSTPQFANPRDFLDKTQNQFYALRMKNYPDTLRFGFCANLERRSLADAIEDAPVKTLSSTYVAAEDRIRDTWYCQGPKILTFAQTLKYGTPRLTDMVNDLTAALAEETGGPVEIELAANLPKQNGGTWEISLLQARPMASPRDKALITREDMDEAVCVSTAALGNCTLDTIRDIVYVNPDTFEGNKTPDMARQISRINADLAKTNRRFLLAGPGRWGSSDPWLGIPVDWQQISRAGAIVEIRDGAIHADASWGSHFFSTLTAQGIPYITVNPGTSTDRIDLAHLTDCRTVRDEGFICHMRLNRPLVIKVDGEHSRCVILDAGKKLSSIPAA